MTPPLVYLGLDVARATLVGQPAGAGFTLPYPNDPAGHRALGARIAARGKGQTAQARRRRSRSIAPEPSSNTADVGSGTLLTEKLSMAGV